MLWKHCRSWIVVSKIQFVLMERTIHQIFVSSLRLRCDVERVRRFVNFSRRRLRFLKCVTDLVAPFGEAEHVLDSLEYSIRVRVYELRDEVSSV